MAQWDVQGKVCVVTGGGSGIGEGLAIRLAQGGAAAVMVADIDMTSCQAVAAKLVNPKTGENVGSACKVDCSSEASIRRLIVTAEFKIGPIDVFISNAGIPSNGGVAVPNEEWETIWKINVMAHVWVARHLFPLMQENGGGKFVITASAAGLLTQVGSLPYSVTKAAAVSVAEWLAVTYHDSDIGVSCLCPQAVQTGFIPPGVGEAGGGVAGGDGILQPSDVADAVVEAMAAGTFLVLPHKEVGRYILNKAKDYDRWLKGMRKLNSMFGAVTASSPPFGLPEMKQSKDLKQAKI